MCVSFRGTWLTRLFYNTEHYSFRGHDCPASRDKVELTRPENTQRRQIMRRATLCEINFGVKLYGDTIK
jgi:hypothetical protein